jgi:hypothetical protein
MPISSYLSRRSLTNLAFFAALLLATVIVAQSKGCGAVSMRKMAHVQRSADLASPDAAHTDLYIGNTVEAAERQIARTGSMRMVSDPARTTDAIQKLTADFAGLVDRSVINGERERASTAEVTVRVPAQRFDEFRGRVRQLGRVQQDSVQARDVTKEATDQQATLRNYRAEEEQYLALLKRAASVKDTADVTEKLANVRGRIDRLESEIRVLQQQVQMSQLSIEILAEYSPEATQWRPLYEARQALRNALDGLTDFIDSVFSILVFVPVILLWAVFIFVLLKLGWVLVRRLGRIFFPALPLWSKK